MSSSQSPDGLSVRLINDVKAFDALEPAWNRLEGKVPFRSFRWHRTWWKYFSGEHSLNILAVYDQSNCIGIAPLFVERMLAGSRVAQFIGSGEVATDQQSILAAPGHADEVSTEIAQWLNGDQNTVADLLQLDGVDVNCDVFASFENAARAANYTLVDTSSIHTWRLPLPATMDDYVSSLSKSCRRKVRTALKRFASGELTVSIANDTEAFEENWNHFVNLHQLRRASLGENGCFADEKFSAFLHDIASQFFATGELDMVCISKDDKAIATEICFRGPGCSYAYQIGNDPNSLKDNPGWLVNTASIQHAIDLGLNEFDFCRGDFEYKRQLGAEAHICRRLRMTPPRLRSQVLNAAITGGTAVRNWCQSTLHFSTTTP